MIERDARGKDLERQLADAPAPDPVCVHPGMDKTYVEPFCMVLSDLDHIYAAAGADLMRGFDP